MRLRIIPKTELSPEQLRQATLRIFAPEHNCDVGPRMSWNRLEHYKHHLTLFDAESDEFVGTVDMVLHPPVAQDFSWWLDSRMRKKGYGRALANDLAAYLKKRYRIEKMGFIIFGKEHLDASRKIAQRLAQNIEGTGSDSEWPWHEAASDQWQLQLEVPGPTQPIKDPTAAD